MKMPKTSPPPQGKAEVELSAAGLLGLFDGQTWRWRLKLVGGKGETLATPLSQGLPPLSRSVCPVQSPV